MRLDDNVGDDGTIHDDCFWRIVDCGSQMMSSRHGTVKIKYLFNHKLDNRSGKYVLGILLCLPLVQVPT